MDPNTIDRLARFIGSGQSRRRVLKSLAGGALGAVATAVGLDHASAAARCRAQGVVCSKNADCCSSTCLSKDRTGRRYCGGGCQSANDCPGASDPCHTATCSAGVCGFAVNVNGRCDDGDPCTTGDVCQANGTCAGTPVVCQPLDQCHLAGTCGAGACSNPPAASGTPCSTGVCDGAGACVQCRDANDCPAPTDLCQQATCSANLCGTAPVCDDQAGACPSGQVCCGGACTDTSGDASHCGSCAKICRVADSCQSGVCSGPGTCPAGSDYCLTGTQVTCDGSGSCFCHTTTTGALFCGTGPAVCADCNVDADCVGLGAGSACLDLGTNCSSCAGSNTPTHVCQAPCGNA